MSEITFPFAYLGTGALGIEQRPSVRTAAQTPRLNDARAKIVRITVGSRRPGRENAAETIWVELLENGVEAALPIRAHRDYRLELSDKLDRVGEMGAGWDGADAPAPSGDSIARAKQLAMGLPPTSATVQVGLGEDGNVFLHAQHGPNHVYVTVESNALHFLGKGPGRDPQYIDNEPYDGQYVPPSILEAFQKHLTP